MPFLLPVFFLEFSHFSSSASIVSTDNFSPSLHLLSSPLPLPLSGTHVPSRRAFPLSPLLTFTILHSLYIYLYGKKKRQIQTGIGALYISLRICISPSRVCINFLCTHANIYTRAPRLHRWNKGSVCSFMPTLRNTLAPVHPLALPLSLSCPVRPLTCRALFSLMGNVITCDGIYLFFPAW